MYDAMVVGFCGGLQEEELFLASMKGMLKFWEETRKKKEERPITHHGDIKGVVQGRDQT